MSKNSIILACINGVAPSNHVLEYATWASKKLAKKLRLFHSLDQQYNSSELDLSGAIALGESTNLIDRIAEIEHEQNRLLLKKGQLILERAESQAEKLGVINAEMALRKGRLIDNALSFEEETALVVIGRYGQRHQGEKSGAVIGHKVEAMVRALKKPVLVIDKEFVAPKSVLLAYDDSEASNHALNLIESNGLFSDVLIKVVYVGEDSDKMRASLIKACASLQEKGINAEYAILSGEPVATINEYVRSNEHDMIVMGAYGHNWLHDFVMGSFTSKMLINSERPVLLVR